MPDKQSILVAVDLPLPVSDLSPIVELAQRTGWRVHLLHVAAPNRFFAPNEVAELEEQDRRDQELTDEYDHLMTEAAALFSSSEAGVGTGSRREREPDGKVDLETEIVVGPTIDTILSRAEDCNAALIAVVGHRHGLAHKVVLGSVTSTLLKVSDRPVLVLPAVDDDMDADTQPGFVAAIDRLIHVIDRDDQSDELADLRDAATTQLAEPGSKELQHHLGGRLVDALHRFETEHPTLTRAINDVSYYLSGMGI